MDLTSLILLIGGVAVLALVVVWQVRAFRRRDQWNDPMFSTSKSIELALPDREAWQLVKGAVSVNYRMVRSTDETGHEIRFRTGMDVFSYGERLTARVEADGESARVTLTVSPTSPMPLQARQTERDFEDFFEAVNLAFEHRNDPISRVDDADPFA